MRRGPARAGVALGAVLAIAGCDDGRRGDATPAETQPGIAADATAAPRAARGCDALPDAKALRRALVEAPGDGEAGGLFGGRKEWAAIVDRAGRICAAVVATDDPSAAWPGSQAIAKAKAYTANAFSTDDAPLSTARLYSMAQPGAALYGIASANPVRPDCVVAPEQHDDSEGKICGGAIAFGGGVPLYRDGQRVGGLGASGDTACADHEIAKRMRHHLGLDPAGGAFADDITYSSADGASPYTHPLCPNTWRNLKKLGDPAPPSTY